MMHPVVRCTHKNVRKPTVGGFYQMVVVQKLNEIMGRRNQHKNRHGNAQHRQADKKRKRSKRGIPRVSDAQRQAKMLALVMHHVYAPKP